MKNLSELKIWWSEQGPISKIILLMWIGYIGWLLFDVLVLGNTELSISDGRGGWI